MRTLTLTGIMSDAVAELAHDAAVPILFQRADDLGGIGELVRLELRCKHHQDLALAHRHVDRTEIEDRMAEAEHALAVVIGGGAETR